MTPEPSGRPAARSFPDGSKRAKDAPETRDVWMVVGWVMVNGLKRVAFMIVCGQAYVAEFEC